MNQVINNALLGVILAPLFGSMISGLFCRKIGRVASHSVTIAGVAISFLLSVFVFYQFIAQHLLPINETLYVWTMVGSAKLQVGLLIDYLTLMMMMVVTFVSLAVHVYTIGYMHDDDGYQRFFSYISLFTFAMLMLVMSNNFVQLFFGWEAVGVVSYLLIGFWFKKDSAIFANMKAFLVNRVGDFGFLLGIAAIYFYFGSLDYAEVFSALASVVKQNLQLVLWSDHSCSVVTFICICLFIGAMGKSAQMPLHVWLPDSMEGPTPISALIHAATMVTAGVFMVARMSPLFEHSEVARSVIIIIGACTALFMGLLGLVMFDIKRVVAYSTLSQLGYMMTALGASAYSVGVFHLMTHAFFKALLFLAAGSVIIAMHHEQDMRRMGNLRKYMPITYVTSLLGSLALAGIPPFSGFYSKDLIIEMVGESHIYGAGFAYFAVVASVFVTAFYSFRLFFWVFHTKERMDEETKHHLHETPTVVWGPLVLLAIPSVFIGMMTVGPMLFSAPNFFSHAITVLPENNHLLEMSKEYHGPIQMALHAVYTLPFWLAIAGIVAAWFCYVVKPAIPEKIAGAAGPLYRFMLNKYCFDDFNQAFFAKGTQKIGALLWRAGDQTVIDGGMVNGTAKLIAVTSTIVRRIQTGYLYHYAFVMIVGLLVLIAWAIGIL